MKSIRNSYEKHIKSIKIVVFLTKLIVLRLNLSISLIKKIIQLKIKIFKHVCFQTTLFFQPT